LLKTQNVEVGSWVGGGQKSGIFVPHSTQVIGPRRTTAEALQARASVALTPTAQQYVQQYNFIMRRPRDRVGAELKLGVQIMPV